MPQTPGELLKHHLDQAKGYAQPLQAERSDESLESWQGHALRAVIYNCTVALCAALERRG